MEQFDDTLNGGTGNDLGESKAAPAIDAPAPSATDSETDTASSTIETASDELDADDATPGDTSESEAGDESDDAYVEALGEKLREADSERFDALTQKFVSDESFAADEISWIAQVTGHDEATVRYGLSLQREAYRTNQPVDTSVADAEAEVGDIDSLIGFVKDKAPAEKLREWQTVADFAKRTNDPQMTLGLLREMKSFKESIPGTKPKTLGHLASAQAPKESQPSDPPVEQAAQEPEVDPQLEQMRAINSQALARIAQNGTADPAARARAVAILRERGILK